MAEQELRIGDEMRELYSDYRILEKQEKQAVRRINFEVSLRCIEHHLPSGVVPSICLIYS